MEDDILIDNYLKGLLAKNDEKLFLERLKSDVEFKEKFELEKQLFNVLNEDSWSFVEKKTLEAKAYKKVLEDNDLQNLKKTLTQANSEFNKKPNQGNRKLFYYLAAASIAIFLATQFFFNQNVTNQDLYNDYVKLNDLPSFVSRSDDSKELTKAQSLFENKKYKEALVIFQSSIYESSDNGSVYIYKGLSQIELGQYAKAEETFNSFIESDLIDAEKGYWYKALLFIKTDRVEEAKNTLAEIVSKSLYNNSKAKELLIKLNDE